MLWYLHSILWCALNQLRSTIIPSDCKDRIKRMPLDGGGSDGPRKLILMFFPTFIIQVYFIRGGDGDRRVDGHIRNCDPDNLFIIAFEFPDFGFWEKAHANLNTQKYRYKIEFKFVIIPSCQINTGLLIHKLWGQVHLFLSWIPYYHQHTN